MQFPILASKPCGEEGCVYPSDTAKPDVCDRNLAWNLNAKKAGNSRLSSFHVSMAATSFSLALFDKHDPAFLKSMQNGSANIIFLACHFDHISLHHTLFLFLCLLYSFRNKLHVFTVKGYLPSLPQFKGSAPASGPRCQAPSPAG